jgi:P-type E1-E2 ATPase
MERGISVLIASCPCALGLAIPSVIANILNLAIKSNILIKRPTVFEKIKSINMVAFDKTGTLFTKINQIEEYKVVNDELLTEEEQWEMLALLERDIRHPLAEIIYKESFNRS